MHRTARLAIAALALTVAAACGSSDGAPSSHKVSKNGVMHMTGLTNPLVNCVACHGPSLQGGEGPSCTSCHGVKW
jgi:hypothetical protein